MPKHQKDNLYSLLHEVALSLPRSNSLGGPARPGQNRVLKVLYQEGPLLTQQLRKKLGITSSTLSETLKRLQAEGLISRERSNRGGNELVVSLTDEGRVRAAERQVARDAREEHFFHCLTDEERIQLEGLLSKLLDAWREEDPLSDGERRERRWKANAAAQDEESEINALLDAVASKSR